MRWAAPVVVALALVTACGVPEDDGPEVLSAEDVPFGLMTVPTTTTTLPTDLPPSRQATLYFLLSSADEDLLRAIRRPVDDRSHGTIITALLDTEAEALPSNARTAIPPDTELLATTLDDRVLTIELSEEFSTVQGQGSINAVAQIVYTATDLPGVDEVEFQVEGEDFRVSDDESVQQDGPVDRDDYTLLAPA